jgi:hypothetical protein
MTKPEYQFIESGIIMRIGVSDIAQLPNQTMRGVVRKDEAIGYKVELDARGIQNKPFGWSHLQYRFTYRYDGRTISVPWRCGLSYGPVNPIDGLHTAFQDAAYIAYHAAEGFGLRWMENLGYDLETDYDVAKRAYDACARMHDRLYRFFGDSHTRDDWESAIEGWDERR